METCFQDFSLPIISKTMKSKDCFQRQFLQWKKLYINTYIVKKLFDIQTPPPTHTHLKRHVFDPFGQQSNLVFLGSHFPFIHLSSGSSAEGTAPKTKYIRVVSQYILSCSCFSKLQLLWYFHFNQEHILFAQWQVVCDWFHMMSVEPINWKPNSYLRLLLRDCIEVQYDNTSTLTYVRYCYLRSPLLLIT